MYIYIEWERKEKVIEIDLRRNLTNISWERTKCRKIEIDCLNITSSFGINSRGNRAKLMVHLVGKRVNLNTVVSGKKDFANFSKNRLQVSLHKIAKLFNFSQYWGRSFGNVNQFSQHWEKTGCDMQSLYYYCQFKVALSERDDTWPKRY